MSTAPLMAFSPLIRVLEPIGSCLSRWAFLVLTVTFLLFSLLASAVAFFYPLEIETRESTVWLHALAINAGVNIYDQSKVIFVNLNHGPFDPLVKLGIAKLFPFFEPWQVTRFAVFLLPYMFLIIAWRLIGVASLGSFMHVLYFGSVGYLLLVVSAKEFLFVGRSDVTVAALLLMLLYVSISLSPRTKSAAAIYGCLWGVLATLIILTNWRTGPTVVAISLFTAWLFRYQKQASRAFVGVYVAYCAIGSLLTSVVMLYYVSGLNLSVYYQYFFGFYSSAAGWSSRQHWNSAFSGSLTSFILDLFNPTAPPNALKGGPLVLALVAYTLISRKGEPVNRAWLLLGGISFVSCALAYYLNWWGGGSWYFIPFLIILWFFLCTNYSRITQARLTLLGLFLLALFCVNFRTVLLPTISRALTMRHAGEFMNKVRSLEKTNRVLSEDTFFFRTRYGGELIDMGDTVSVFAKSAYFGEGFKKTVQRHFDQIRQLPPDYVLTGFAGSPELKELVHTRYSRMARGGGNFTANGGGESELFIRNDLATADGRALGLEQASLYSVWEMQVVNPKKYFNPFNFTEIELQATFTAPSGKKINFFGFFDGDGNGGQTGNVWKLRIMPDEVGRWNYTYTWTDKTPGGSGTFRVVDSGLPGPLKVAIDNPWYFTTARGKPFHARPYGMQDYGPRIKSSSGWEKNSQEYIDTLKTKVIARGYNMVMASGPNRFGEGRSYWWKNQWDIFDVAVWHEYEKVLRYALGQHIYFFPFDGMAEQPAFGMPVSRFTKYISKVIPVFDLSVGRVTPIFKRYMVARFGAFASFMGYSPTWEWSEFWSEADANKFMSEIRSWNPFPTLLSAHDSSRAGFTGWMGFSMRQANEATNNVFAGNCRACGNHDGVQAPFDNLPILASEDIWEVPPRISGYVSNVAEVRRGAWGIMMAGVLPVYSEWFWDFFMGKGQGEPEVRRMFDFFYSKTRYRDYRQLNQLVSRTERQIASGISGEQYLVYDEDGGAVTVDLSGVSLAAMFSVLWFDPKTGVEQSGRNITGGAFKTLTAPFSGDSVLLLRRVSADMASQ